MADQQGNDFSAGYYVAMEKIEIELLRRDPRYRDPNHHNWHIFGNSPSAKERQSYINNTIACAMARNSAILAHSILGTADPDNPPEPVHSQYDPCTRILGAILYQTPFFYIDDQDCIWFNMWGDDPNPAPGHQVFYEDIMLMMDFADFADALRV